MIRYIIIDDEPIAHRIIEGYCKNLSHLQKVGNCYNAFEAVQMLSEISADLLFLDINMPKLSGFDLLKSLDKHPKIIVTTAYKEFALEGYELNISDYLLKPFSLERFMKAINKTIVPDIKDIPHLGSKETNTVESLFIKGDKKHHGINSDTILFIEAYGKYTKIYLKDEMIISHQKISTFENLLSNNHFLRVHKSFIVAINKIGSIEGNRININNHKIPIGQTYKSNISRLYNL